MTLGKSKKSKRSTQTVRAQTSVEAKGEQAQQMPLHTEKRNRLFFFIVMPIAILLLWGLLFMLNKQEEKMKEAASVSGPSVTFDLTGQPTMGSPHAKVSIVEFGDYKCPACRVWETDVFPQLKQEFIDTGKAKYSFINYTSANSLSQIAAHAGEEVFRQNPDVFWKFHKALHHAPELEGEEPVTVPMLLNIAKKSAPEIDLKQLEKAIRNRSTEPSILQDLKLTNLAKIKITPKVFVNGEEFTGQWDSYDQLKSFIEAIQNKVK